MDQFEECPMDVDVPMECDEVSDAVMEEVHASNKTMNVTINVLDSTNANTPTKRVDESTQQIVDVLASTHTLVDESNQKVTNIVVSTQEVDTSVQNVADINNLALNNNTDVNLVPVNHSVQTDVDIDISAKNCVNGDNLAQKDHSVVILDHTVSISAQNGVNGDNLAQKDPSVVILDDTVSISAQNGVNGDNLARKDHSGVTLDHTVDKLVDIDTSTQNVVDSDNVAQNNNLVENFEHSVQKVVDISAQNVLDSDNVAHKDNPMVNLDQVEKVVHIDTSAHSIVENNVQKDEKLTSDLLDFVDLKKTEEESSQLNTSAKVVDPILENKCLTQPIVDDSNSLVTLVDVDNLVTKPADLTFEAASDFNICDIVKSDLETSQLNTSAKVVDPILGNKCLTQPIVDDSNSVEMIVDVGNSVTKPADLIIEAESDLNICDNVKSDLETSLLNGTADRNENIPNNTLNVETKIIDESTEQDVEIVKPNKIADVEIAENIIDIENSAQIVVDHDDNKSVELESMDVVTLDSITESVKLEQLSTTDDEEVLEGTLENVIDQADKSLQVLEYSAPDSPTVSNNTVNVCDKSMESIKVENELSEISMKAEPVNSHQSIGESDDSFECHIVTNISDKNETKEDSKDSTPTLNKTIELVCPPKKDSLNNEPPKYDFSVFSDSPAKPSRNRNTIFRLFDPLYNSPEQVKKKPVVLQKPPEQSVEQVVIHDLVDIPKDNMDEKLKMEEELNQKKLELNQLQQDRASLELELHQKDEVILKIQGEAQKKECQLKIENKQLLDKLSTVNQQNSNEEVKLLKEEKAALKEQIAQLKDKVDQFAEKEAGFKNLLQDYDATMTRMVQESEKLKVEHDTAKKHLATLEMAFSDVHTKYERCKDIITGYKHNEETLAESLDESNQIARKYEERYESLKAHAKTQLDKANKDLAGMKEKHHTEMNKLTTIIRCLEIKNGGIQQSLDQKNKECADLTALCAEMTGSVPH